MYKFVGARRPLSYFNGEAVLNATEWLRWKRLCSAKSGQSRSILINCFRLEAEVAHCPPAGRRLV